MSADEARGSMLVAPLIERKRNGETLGADEWSQLIAAYVAGDIPDYQMSALLMAIYFRGMAPLELAALTAAMLDSGERLRLGGLGAPVIDKHSTGGIGDKVSLVLAPLAASCGLMVPMMSGRALGHTGGTLDKLESIPGLRTAISLAEAEAQLGRIGCVMMGQTEEIGPADRLLYALRDVTATVESLPLLASSIMSKKLAEGLDGLVLDIKAGSGAFLPEIERAVELGEALVGLGAAHGCRTVALVTAMDRPLGHACGNALEVEEAIAALRGEGPPDLMAVTMALGVEMVLLAGASSATEAEDRLRRALTSGRALETFARVIEAQGGNPAIVGDPAGLPQAPVSGVYTATAAGTVSSVEPRIIGQAVVALGGGRSRVGDSIDPAVGFVVTVKPGDIVERGQPLASVYARDDAGVELGLDALERAIRLGGDAASLPLIVRRIPGDGVASR